MPIKPLIHTNIDVLKTKLQKYEPIKIARRIGIDATIVIAVDKLTYDSNIPILKEKHLNKYSPSLVNKLKKRKLTPRSEEDGEPGDHSNNNPQHARLAGSPPDRPNETPHQVENSSRPNLEVNPLRRLGGSPINRSDDPKIIEIPIGGGHRNEKQDEENDSRAGFDEPMPENRRDSQFTGEFNGMPDDEPDDEENEVANQSKVDRLVLTGPDEDEFRQYSDDEDDEETTLSKNLKKIRAEPPPPPPPPKQVVPPQAPPRPTDIRIPAVPVPLPVVKAADIDRLFEQKNYKLLYAELKRQKETFKEDDVARSTLKKTIFSSLERDDTFMLLEFLGLVFEYDYLCDTEFWDELIGKLKRKANPHAKCLTFKSDVEPKLVLHNYLLTVRKIAEHFDSNNPIIKLSWHNSRYLCESTMSPTSNNNCISSSHMKPTPFVKNDLTTPCPETGIGVAQENLDPTTGCERDVSYFQDTDGKRKYKIRVPKGERKFSAII